ncbi:MAG: DUF456 domain-containing protein [bacterium]
MQKIYAFLKTVLIFLPKIGVVLFALAGIVLVPLGFPGTWVIAGTALLYSFFFDFNPSGSDVWVVLFLLFLAVLGEVLEYLVSVLGGKQLDVSTGAIVASIVGGLIGAFVGVPVFLIGSLLGLFLGVFLGALAYELIVTKNLLSALRSAIAVFFSRLVASFVKTCLAVGMGIYLCFKIF